MKELDSSDEQIGKFLKSINNNNIKPAKTVEDIAEMKEITMGFLTQELGYGFNKAITLLEQMLKVGVIGRKQTEEKYTRHEFPYLTTENFKPWIMLFLSDKTEIKQIRIALFCFVLIWWFYKR